MYMFMCSFIAIFSRRLSSGCIKTVFTSPPRFHVYGINLLCYHFNTYRTEVNDPNDGYPLVMK